MDRIAANSTHLHQPVDKRLHGDLPAFQAHTKRLTNPAPPEDRRERCLRIVQMALEAGNRDEAHAAINRAFEPESDSITLESHVVELGISLRTANYLEEAGIHTVEALANATPDTLLQIPGFGAAAVKECQQALSQAIQNGLTDAA